MPNPESIQGEFPDFSTMTEEGILDYAHKQAEAARQGRAELLCGVEVFLGSQSPSNAARLTEARILRAAGLLNDAAYEERSRPVVITGGLRITM